MSERIYKDFDEQKHVLSDDTIIFLSDTKVIKFGDLKLLVEDAVELKAEVERLRGSIHLAMKRVIEPDSMPESPTALQILDDALNPKEDE